MNVLLTDGSSMSFNELLKSTKTFEAIKKQQWVQNWRANSDNLSKLNGLLRIFMFIIIHKVVLSFDTSREPNYSLLHQSFV